MFNTARLKLTAWYVLIIMLVSASFSAVIYMVVCKELARSYRWVVVVDRAHRIGIGVPRHLPKNLENLDPQLQNLAESMEYQDALKEAKRRFAYRLVGINSVILLVSGSAAYFLAGKTLQPIQKALEEQKRFVADASHELRTPLTALKTSMEVALRNKEMGLAEAREVIESNLADVEDLKNLSNNLLTLSRVTENGDKTVLDEVDLSAVIETAVDKLQTLAEEKNIVLDLDLSKITLKGDKDNLREMISVFVDNAIKYTPGGGKVKISTRTEKEYAVIEVADTGIGIAEEDLPHIFDRFYRADKSWVGRDDPGFGLGLSVAKEIINLHHGYVDVESTLGEGSKFIIKLPLSL